jgi:hypothetical protein
MTAQLWVNDASTARQIREVWVNDNGTARRINEIWCNDSGVARKIFVGDAISISDMSCVAGTVGLTATAVYTLGSDGNIYGTEISNTVIDRGDWITPQTNMSSFECRATLVSGTLTSGTVGTWLNLGSNRTWTRTRTTLGVSSTTMTVEIRRASDAVVVDSASITLTADFGFDG